MNLLIRADASVAIGTGHVMRCLALAQAWQDAGGQATFAMAETTTAIEARLACESCEVVPVASPPGSAGDASQLTALAQHRNFEWIVVDGYCFSAEYQLALKNAGLKVLFIDDSGRAKHYFADIVLNQNVHADEKMYEAREAYTRLLLGPRYCMLRREFAPWREWKREIAAIGRRVLVTVGGSDAENLTGRLIEALVLAKSQPLEATVVIGGSNSHFAKLQKLAAESAKQISMMRDAQNLAKIMADSDVAVSAAGSTCWELCLLGLPSLLIDVAPNQTDIAKELARRGCAIHLGDRGVLAKEVARQLDILLQLHERRQILSERSRMLVDGCGAQHVVSALRGGNGLRLRRVRREDSHLLWEWANDAQVRAASFCSDPISWPTHAAWFEQKLAQENCTIFIAEDEESNPCGQIRFDPRPDGGWEVGVSVAKEARGRGVASRLIGSGVRSMLNGKASSARFHAFVKLDNTASIRAFEKAEFRQLGSEQVHGKPAIHFVYQKNGAGH